MERNSGFGRIGFRGLVLGSPALCIYVEETDELCSFKEFDLIKKILKTKSLI